MYIQYGVRLIAVVYVVLGLVGFIPIERLNPVMHEDMVARYLLHLVAINAWHNVIHLVIGVSGLWAALTPTRMRVWGMIAGVVLMALFAAGMLQAAIEGFPHTQLFLGLVPLNPPGHALHIISGGLALYLGLVRMPH